MEILLEIKILGMPEKLEHSEIFKNQGQISDTHNFWGDSQTCSVID